MFNVEITGDFDGDEFREGLYVDTEEQLTTHAREHNCPSHGRSTRAQVTINRETGAFSFSGICCEAAVEALLRSVADEVEEGDDDEEDGVSEWGDEE